MVRKAPAGPAAFKYGDWVPPAKTPLGLLPSTCIYRVSNTTGLYQLWF